jgi:hypothetical protein
LPMKRKSVDFSLKGRGQKSATLPNAATRLIHVVITADHVIIANVWYVVNAWEGAKAGACRLNKMCKICEFAVISKECESAVECEHCGEIVCKECTREVHLHCGPRGGFDKTMCEHCVKY